MKKIKRVIDRDKLNHILNSLYEIKVEFQIDEWTNYLKNPFFNISTGEPDFDAGQDDDRPILATLSLLMYKRISDSYVYYKGNYRIKIPDGCLWSDMKSSDSYSLLNKVSKNLKKIYELNNLFTFQYKKPIVKAFDLLDDLNIINTEAQIKIYNILNNINLSPQNISDIELIYILEKFNTSTGIINEKLFYENKKSFYNFFYYEDEFGINADESFYSYNLSRVWKIEISKILELLEFSDKNLKIYFHDLSCKYEELENLKIFRKRKDIPSLHRIFVTGESMLLELYKTSALLLNLCLILLNRNEIESTSNYIMTVGGDNILDEAYIFALMLPVKIESMWHFSLSNETDLLSESEAVNLLNSENIKNREKAIKSLAVHEIKNFDIRITDIDVIEKMDDLQRLTPFKNSFKNPNDTSEIILPYPFLLIDNIFLQTKNFKIWLYSLIRKKRIQGLTLYNSYGLSFLILNSNTEKKLKFNTYKSMSLQVYFLPWFFITDTDYKHRKNSFKFIFDDIKNLVRRKKIKKRVRSNKEPWIDFSDNDQLHELEESIKKVINEERNNIKIDFLERFKIKKGSFEISLDEALKSGFHLLGFYYKKLPEFIEKKEAIRMKDICRFITNTYANNRNELAKTGYLVREADLSKYLKSAYLDVKNLQKTKKGVLIEDECIVLSLKTLNHAILKPENEPIKIKPGKNIVIIIPDKTKVNTKYLYYILQSPCVLEQLNGFYPDKNPDDPVDFEILKNVIIPLPSLEEQLIYVKYIDELIDSIMKLPEKLSKKEDSSERADEYKLIGYVAHELKNKLPFVNESIDIIRDFLIEKNLISEKAFKDNSFEYYIDKSKKFLTHVNDIVRTVRDLLSEDFKEEDFEKTNICDFIKKIAPSHCQMENIRIDFRCKHPIFANIHKRAIELVIANLIKNAETHAFPPGTEYAKNPLLIFEIKEIDNHIIIDYMNNGVPLPKEIDTESFLTPGKKTSDSKGYGLGGAIIKRMIREVHRGEIKLIHDDYPFHLQIKIPKNRNEGVVF
ncbi:MULTISPECIES: ATP-binding protein [Thermodesulfovibrio]|uniref:ATP-binding protein n=1 Tax=Thermodesulfovibrio TaxID=28261 RepID=UPI0026125EC9|nr:ATP-binding protein [Thermodesulfovibrio sp.]